MSGRLDRRDKQLLIGAGFVLILLAAVAAVVSPPRVSEEEIPPSSYSPAWAGAAGAYLLLDQLGYRVEHWEKPLDALPMKAEGAVLILADPDPPPPTSDDRIAVRRFLEAGGRVLATGPSAAPYLPNALAFTPALPWEANRRFSAREPSPLARGVAAIELPGPRAWHPREPAHLVAFGDGKAAAVVTWPFGRGEVIWWASSVPLTNGGILLGDNPGLLLNSVGPAGTRVFWDEYIHGLRGSLWSFFAATPVPWALGEFGLVFLALLFTYSRRPSPARMPAMASRLSPLEFVETLGDLYHSARAGAAAVGVAQSRLRFLLARQMGLPPTAGAREVARRAGERLGWEEGSLYATLSRAERMARATAVNEREALRLVQELDSWIGRLQRGTREKG